MKNKRILIIDDGNVEQIVQRMTLKLKRKGIHLETDVLNVNDEKFKKMHDEGQRIDFAKVKEYIKNEYFSKRYDIVLCDFSYGGDPLNGYEVIKWIINESANQKVRIRRSIFVSYSSQEEKFKAEIFGNHSLKKFIRLGIHDFFDRANLANEIPSLILKQDKILDYKQYLISLFEQQPDFVFKNGFPPFCNKKLKDIAKEVERDNDLGIEFQTEFLELTYAHIIRLNEEYQ